MKISQFVELMRKILVHEPDESAFMAETYAADRRFESDDFNILVNYIFDHSNDCEIFTITDMDPSTRWNGFCTIKKSEVISGQWLYQTGKTFDICEVDEDLDTSIMLQDVANQHGDARSDKIIKLADYLLNTH